jgi:hypothetical protein
VGSVKVQGTARGLEWQAVVAGLGALVFGALGTASLLDALTGSHLASVDRPRRDAAIWGVIGIVVAVALTRRCVLRVRRRTRARRSG